MSIYSSSRNNRCQIMLSSQINRTCNPNNPLKTSSRTRYGRSRSSCRSHNSSRRLSIYRLMSNNDMLLNITFLPNSSYSCNNSCNNSNSNSNSNQLSHNSSNRLSRFRVHKSRSSTLSNRDSKFDRMLPDNRLPPSQFNRHLTGSYSNSKGREPHKGSNSTRIDNR